MADQARELTPGMRVHGLVPGAVAEILEVTMIGASALVRYRDDLGLEGTRILAANDLASITRVTDEGPSLDATADDFWLAVEAMRIRHSHLLNPLLAVTCSNVEALPHQVQAVYDYLLREHPQRFLLADDPGAGKTIMAGLYIKESLARDWVRRCLIVVPGGLAEQWQEELREKFGLAFDIFETSMIETATAGVPPLERHPFLIARLDQFARCPKLADLIEDAPYDLAIFDEAHKLATRSWGSKILKTRRYELGERIGDLSPSLLLMTATPHNGKEDEYQRFLSLLRRDAKETPVTDAASAGLMRRLIKEQLVHLDGSRLFPDRRASTVGYRLSALERDLYEDVSQYVREEMNKVSGEESRRGVGFALLVLQRRLASSPQAILRSLIRRRDRLQNESTRLQDADRRLADSLAASLGLQVDDPDELSAANAETYEDNAASVATAARTLEELETEISILDRLVRRAQAVRDAHVDAKWDALAELLTSEEMHDPEGIRRKIIIFTEHRDTLEYLEDQLFDLLPARTGVEVIHGLMSRGDRRLAQLRFTQDAGSTILLATDAAGEGVNLQAAHLMVNYDIPWNPNRLEQRFGRIHRIGQRHNCHLWNLVALDTREGDVFTTLLQKLEIQREALGDQVFDVLGQVLTDANLGQLLARALEGASGAEIDADLEQVSRDLADAVRERAAGISSLTREQIAELRKSMELSRVASFQPDVVREFTLRAMAALHGSIEQRGQIWQVRHVPESVRSAFGPSVRARYDAITFDRTEGPILSTVVPELVAPGHPLLGALVSSVEARLSRALLRGVLLEDDRTSEDYTLVTVVSGDAERDPRTLETYAVTPEEAPQPVDPALYTSLTTSSLKASVTDLACVQEAIAAVAAGPHAGDVGTEVLVVAQVRGTADPVTAGAWASSRVQLLETLRVQVGGDQIVEALPGAGWDFMTTADKISFVRAVPATCPAPQRRAERHAAANAGSAYVTAVVQY